MAQQERLQALLWWRHPAPRDRHVRCEFALLQLDSCGLDGSRHVTLQALELEFGRDADPELTDSATRWEVTEPPQLEREGPGVHAAKGLDHVLEAAPVDLADEGEGHVQRRRIGPADVGQALLQAGERVLVIGWEVERDEQSMHDASRAGPELGLVKRGRVTYQPSAAVSKRAAVVGTQPFAILKRDLILANNPDAFAREVDEELREDRLKAIWKRYGFLIVGGALALVLATAASVGWRAWQEGAQRADAEAFEAAIRDHAEAGATADALVAVANDANDGFRVVSRLTAAQLYASADATDAARDVLATLAADGGVPALYRDLARLLNIAAGIDDQAPDAVLAELQPLAAAGAPWRHSARELVAAAQLRAGDTMAARATLEELVADAETPPALRSRARELVAALGGTVEE